MSKFRIFWNNKVDICTVSASTEQSDFPASRLQHIWKKRTWRSDGAVAETITFAGPGGQSIGVEAFIAEYHNLPLTTQVTLYANTVNSISGAPVMVTPCLNNDRMAYIFNALQLYPYWILELYYGSGASGEYMELGRPYLGCYFEFDKHFQNQIPALEDPSDIIESDHGQASSNQIDRFDEFKFQWCAGAVKDTEITELREIWDVIGKSVPYFLQYDSDIDPCESIRYVLNSSKWEFNPLVYSKFGITIDVKESR